MALAHAALTEQEVGPAAWKVASPEAPSPMRAMAARGLAPLPPRDLIVAVYQIWVTNDPELGTQAAKTVEGLPAAVLDGALADAELPQGVIDFLGRKLARNAEMLQKIVSHPNVHDDTLAGVSRLCPDPVCETLAANQQRWLQAPTIVEALYQNPNCRMSTAQRMIEFAVRQGLDLKLPNFEEIKAALGDAAPQQEEDGDDAGDAAFRAAAGLGIDNSHQKLVDRVQRSGAGDTLDYDAARDAVSGDDELDIDQLLAQTASDDMTLPMDGDDQAEAPKADKEDPDAGKDRVTLISRLGTMKKIRLALLGNAFERSVLIRDANKSVCMTAIKSPRVKENEVVAYAANRTLGHEVVRYIARRREWAKLYAVKMNLVLNPKTPMSVSMGFLSHLRANDVRKVAHSRNIPSALAQAAKRKMTQRR